MAFSEKLQMLKKERGEYNLVLQMTNPVALLCLYKCIRAIGAVTLRASEWISVELLSLCFPFSQDVGVCGTF